MQAEPLFLLVHVASDEDRATGGPQPVEEGDLGGVAKLPVGLLGAQRAVDVDDPELAAGGLVAEQHVGIDRAWKSKRVEMEPVSTSSKSERL